MKKIVITSLHFGPGHIAHLQAWYDICLLAGYKPLLFVNEEYKKFLNGFCYSLTSSLDDVKSFKPDISIVQNVGVEDIQYMNWCKSNGCYIIYILHEPFAGIGELLKEGAYAGKQAIAHIINGLLCEKANRVIVCSKYAMDNCRTYMKRTINKCCRFPLLFPDAYNAKSEIKRQYFSIVGAYCEAHGSNEFLQFAKEAYSLGENINFLIATRSAIEKNLDDPVVRNMIGDGVLKIQQGRPLTTDEINSAYRSSICVWNGYKRSTQSGVLINSFMQGTPVIATRLGSFEEFIVEGRTGAFIDNYCYSSIRTAYESLFQKQDYTEKWCREYFLNGHCAEGQVGQFEKLISSCFES